MNSSRQKRISALLVCALIAAGVVVFFRNRPLSSSQEPEPAAQAPVFGSDTNGTTSPSAAASGSQPQDKTNTNPKPSPAMPSVPAYRGRPAGEVRPNVSEVAGFSEAQRQRMYGDLQNNADAVTKNPDFFAGWIDLGLLKKMIGDYEGARDAWEYAGIIRPKNSISFANLGELYTGYLSDSARAEANFKTAIANKPDDQGSYVSLAGLYDAHARQVEAEAILLAGLEANPAQVNLMKTLAHRYGEQGQYAKAIEWWQRVLQEEPGNAAVKSEIEVLKKKLGQ